MNDPTPLKDLPESLVEFNRERFKSEIAQGIYELMRSRGVNRTRLAELLGVTKPRISQILSGSQNLRAEALADVLLVLGRTPHLVLGVDLDTIRFPVDEGQPAADSKNKTAADMTFPIREYSHLRNRTTVSRTTTNVSLDPAPARSVLSG